MTPCPNRRWRGGLVSLTLAVLLLGGCGLDEGQSWGEIKLDLAVGFEPGASRVEAGRLKTALDYRVAIASIEVEVARVEMTARAEGAAGFDPANPPAGYSLCHNGHCHHDDGRLVDYEDIAKEIAGGGDTPPLVSVTGGVVSLELGTRQVMALSACGELACEVVEPSVVGLVAVEVVSLSVSGTAFDARTGEGRRLDEAGLAFELVWTSEVGAAEPVRVAAEGGWRFGPGQSLGLAVAATLALPASLLDGVDFATLAVTGSGELDRDSFGVAMASAVGEDGTLVVETRRFDN